MKKSELKRLIKECITEGYIESSLERNYREKMFGEYKSLIDRRLSKADLYSDETIREAFEYGFDYGVRFVKEHLNDTETLKGAIQSDERESD